MDVVIPTIVSLTCYKHDVSVTIVLTLTLCAVEQKLHNISRSGQKILLFFDVSDKPSSENDKKEDKRL